MQFILQEQFELCGRSWIERRAKDSDPARAALYSLCLKTNVSLHDTKIATLVWLPLGYDPTGFVQLVAVALMRSKPNRL